MFEVSEQEEVGEAKGESEWCIFSENELPTCWERMRETGQTPLLTVWAASTAQESCLVAQHCSGPYLAFIPLFSPLSAQTERLNGPLFFFFFSFWMSFRNTFLFSFFFKKCLFIYLPVPGLSCGMQDLVPWPGIEPRAPVLGTCSLSHCTTR